MDKKLLLGTVGVIAGGVALFSMMYSGSSSNYIPRAEFTNVYEGQVPDGEYFNRVRSNPATGKFDPNDMTAAANSVRSVSSRRSSIGIQWQELGPNNIGGRTRAILVDNTDNNKVFAGSVTGGLFVSNNAGGTWEPVNDLMENLTISTIAQSSNGDLYVGTGSSFDAGGFAISDGNSKPGGGVFKSTDGGVTFTRLVATTTDHDPSNSWNFVNRIQVDPSNPTHVYAGTGRGLMASTDGGQTWVEKEGPGCGVISGRVDDVEFASNGRLLFVMANRLIYSDNPSGDFCTEYNTVGATDGWVSSSRSDVAICKSDPNQVYAIKVNGQGQLLDVIESTDGGVTWAGVAPGPPSIAIDSNFRLFGDNGQGFYDLAIEVFPHDCDQYIVGGVELYRASPNWYRAALNARAANDLYVHADKQFFTFDPTDDNVLYIGSDGGVGKSINAKSTDMRFVEANRGYNVTQFYGMAMAGNGIVIAGAQDNGTILVDPSQPGTHMDGNEINSGDGFDCEISNIAQMAIVTSQFGNVNRLGLNGNADGARNLGDGPFNSVVRLWETRKDPTSKDSILFNNDRVSNAIGIGDDIKRIFSGTLQLTQPSASIVGGSVFFEDPSKNQIVEDADNDGILRQDGDSVGILNTDLTYNFTFKQPPSDQAQVFSLYDQTFDTGDTLFVLSNTADIEITYILQNDLAVGDSVKVQDSVQALLATVTNGNIYITRDMLHFDRQVRWIRVNDVEFGGMSGRVTSIEYSADGNSLYAGTTSGVVYRYDGLNDLYHPTLDDDVDQFLTRTTVFTQSNREITGLCIHPNDPEKMLVTLGNYQASTHIYEITNVSTATGLGTANTRNVTGDLIDIPVYDAEYDINDDKVVLIGTDFGVWSTSDINAANVEWFVENATLSNVPVTDVRQQRLDWREAANHGQIYLATYGRGMWKTKDFVGIDDDIDFASKDAKLFSDLTVYPNPVHSTANIKFQLPSSKMVDFRVFDLTGKVVRQYLNQSMNEGEAQFEFNVSGFPAGTYFMTVESEGNYNVAKFVVVK